jgi:hypothetical protein
MCKIYWTREVTIREFRQFIRDYPEFRVNTSVATIRTLHGHALVRAIYKFGGLRKLNQDLILGLTIKYHTWSKEEVFEELHRLRQQDIPITSKSLDQLGRQDLLGAVAKFGNLNQFKTAMGLSITRHNYWSDERIISELKPIVAEFGRIPSEAVLKCMGRNDLARAIHKKGGVRKFSELTGTGSIGYYRANDGHYLQSGYECLFDNLLFKYHIPHKVHVKLSTLHTYRSDFLINGTHIEICGYDPKEHPVYFSRLEKKIALYQQLRLPYLLITKKTFNTGIQNTAESLLALLAASNLLPPNLIENTEDNYAIMPLAYWSNLDHIKKELLPLCEKYGRMPTDQEFRKEKKHALVNGIYRYYGSYYRLAGLLGIKVLYKPKGYYTQENAVAEYRQLCTEHQKHLSLAELQKLKAYGLAGYISKNGGFFPIRSLGGLNYPQRKIPSGFYTPEKALQEYSGLCSAAGKYLTAKETRAVTGALATYIEKNGGYPEIREKIAEVRQ